MDLINYEPGKKAKIIGDIFDDYEIAIKSTEYGMVSNELIKKHNGNIELANREYFQINSEDDAFLALTFKYAMVVEYSQQGEKVYKPRYFGLFFKRPWIQNMNCSWSLKMESTNNYFKCIH